MSKKLLAFLGGAIMGGALFAVVPAFASLAPSPSPCATTGTPFLTITQNISNDPDSGVHGNWAVDAFTEVVKVWVGTDGVSYCANANTTNGTFTTTGPLSPEAGVALAAGITGTFTGGENYTFASTSGLTLNSDYSTTSPQNITLPDSTTAGFSWWVNQVFPSVASTTGSSYVDTYSLTYVTANNGTWTDADAASGGDSGDITGHLSTVYVNSSTGSDSNDGTQAHPFATIATALSNVQSGGTVNVASGTYTGDLTIASPVTLAGSEATISGQVSVNAASTTISGFTITNPNGNFGVFITAVGSASITGNTITNIGTASSSATSQSYGVYYQSHTTGDVSGISITNNTISNIGGTANPNKSNGAIGIGDSTGSGVLSSVTITGNTISSVSSVNKGAYGIIVNHGASSGGSTQGLTISQNTISGLSGGWAHAIGLEGNTPSASIQHNTISNVTASGVDAAAAHFEDNASANTVTLSYNSFDTASITYGVTSVVSQSVNAALNYWNAADPNTKVATTSGTITVSPWYTDSGMTTLQSNTTTSGGQASTTLPTEVTASGTSGSVTVTAEIPAGTVVTGSATWNGTISAPTATTTTLNLSGFDTTIGAAIAVGSVDTDLTFDKAVKLTFAGQAGKQIGWYNHAGAFTEITTTCTDNTQTTNDGLAAGGSCKITSGADLVVWTKHFSTFVAYTSSAQTTTSSSGGGGGNGAPAGTLGTSNAVIPTTGTAGSTGTSNTNTQTTPAQTTTPTQTTTQPSTAPASGGSTGGGSVAVATGGSTSGGSQVLQATTSEPQTVATASSSNATSSLAAAAETGAAIPAWVWWAAGIVVVLGGAGWGIYSILRSTPKA